MIQRNLKIVHRPGGTEGWKDTVPYRTPNWRALLMGIALIFVCGIATTPALISLWNLRTSGSPEETIDIVAVTSSTATVTEFAPYNVAQSDPLPTYTPTNTATPSPTATATPTITPSPTLDMALFDLPPVEVTPIPELQLTVDALEARVNQLSQATQTPEPSQRIAGVAVVSVDVALIRRLPGTGYRPMRAVALGTELMLTGIANSGWYEVFYEGNTTGWIWGELVRIESNQ